MNTYSKIEHMTQVQVAYFAGLLDGEGCVRVGRFKNSSGVVRYRAYMVIAMTDRNPINWLVKTVGGKRYIDKKRKALKSKVCFSWTLNAREGAAILTRSLPYLLVKRKQAQNFLAFTKTLMVQKGRKHLSPNVLALRRRLCAISTALNKKGRAA